MILVDTSVWIDHFRRRSAGLSELLETGDVVTHPFVIGELACGNLQNRHDILGYLSHLPLASVATNDEVMIFIEKRKLSGRGIGLIDAHLLASTTLGQTVRLWTSDRVLGDIAAVFGLDYKEEKKPGA
jgi:predicted nucleic acid-binding protein